MTDTTLAAAPPAAEPTAGPPMLGTWSGPLAMLNQPSSDGRYLQLENNSDLQHRDTPLALLFQADLAPGHDGGKQGLGVITSLWAENGMLMGQGCFDMQDPEAASIARKVADGFLGHVSVDLEPSFDVKEDRYDVQDGKLLSQLSDRERAALAEAAYAEMDISPLDYEGPDQVRSDEERAIHQDTLPVPKDRYSQYVAVFSNWKLMSATLVSQPAFADARITMGAGPGPATAASAAPDQAPAPAPAPAAVTAAMQRFAEQGMFALPVAEGNPDWDAAAATARVAKWASSDGTGDKDTISWPKYAKAFLFKDPANAQAVGGYKFPYADVVGGKLQAIPKAVFAVAARLEGADIPDAAKSSIKTQLKGLYAAIGRKQGRKLPPPFAAEGESPGDGALEVVLDAGLLDNGKNAETIQASDAQLREKLADPTPRLPDGTPLEGGVQRQLAQTPVEPGTPGDNDEKGLPQPVNPITKRPRATGRNVITAGAAPLSPPSAWFSDPALPGPTPITITRDGRILGHLAAFDTCHTGFPDSCVKPPRSKTGYSMFHNGSVVCAEGEELAVGLITMGTDHASTRSDVSPQSAMAHYADTGCAVALVRAGEDRYGVWVAGALVPEATEEQVAALRRSPLSGDWRRYGGNLELIAALAVNHPGFPIPRAQARTNDYAQVACLTAAGVLPPRQAPEPTPCQGGASFTLDMDALTDAVVLQVEKRQAERAAALAAVAARADRARATVQAGKAASLAARQAAARERANAHRNAVRRITSKTGA